MHQISTGNGRYRVIWLAFFIIFMKGTCDSRASFPMYFLKYIIICVPNDAVDVAVRLTYGHHLLRSVERGR